MHWTMKIQTESLTPVVSHSHRTLYTIAFSLVILDGRHSESCGSQKFVKEANKLVISSCFNSIKVLAWNGNLPWNFSLAIKWNCSDCNWHQVKRLKLVKNTEYCFAKVGMMSKFHNCIYLLMIGRISSNRSPHSKSFFFIEKLTYWDSVIGFDCMWVGDKSRHSKGGRMQLVWSEIQSAREVLVHTYACHVGESIRTYCDFPFAMRHN